MKYSALKKERNPAICDNMDEDRRHYAKRNKPVLKGKILPDSILMSYLK